MLADFQQALADLVASPPLCNAVRGDETVLAQRYSLTERERARLQAIARHRGMQAACSVYRMNRITPLMMDLRVTLLALGERLPDLCSRYWAEYASGYTHSHLESARFCGWLALQLAPDDPAQIALAQEWVQVSEALDSALGRESEPWPHQSQ